MLKFKYNVMFERVLDTFEMHPGYVRYAYEMLLGCSKTIAIYYYYFTFFAASWMCQRCERDMAQMQKRHIQDTFVMRLRHVCNTFELHILLELCSIMIMELSQFYKLQSAPLMNLKRKTIHLHSKASTAT